MKWFAIAVIIAGAAVSDGANAQNESNRECLTGVVSADLDAKREFQRSFRDLVVSARPRFEELALLNAELQTALAQARAEKLRHLLVNEPDRITVDRGLGAFTNFEWGPADDARLANAEPEFAVLQSRIENLRVENDGHADWPEMRAFVQNELATSEAYSALLSDFRATRQNIDKALRDCKSAENRR